MSVRSSFDGLLLAAPAPVENPDVFSATFSRTGATFWFTLLILVVLGVLSAATNSAIVAWIMLAFGALGLGIIVITSGPLLAIGDGIRSWLRGLSDDPSRAELFGGIIFTLILIGILVLCIKLRRKNPLLAIIVAIIVSAMLFTSPTLQSLALRYADEVAVPVLKALMNGQP